MALIPDIDSIRCSFVSAATGNQAAPLRVSATAYFGLVSDLEALLPLFEPLLSDAERMRASRFVFESDKNTYVLSHTVLRILLSNELQRAPEAITLSEGPFRKPELPGRKPHFNLSHSRGAFSILISPLCEGGIDMEPLERSLDFRAIVRNFFSPLEKDYIFSSEESATERFFELWTRKEALLKAMGTGIADNLPSIEVCKPHNIIDSDSFGSLLSEVMVSDHYFIYSLKQNAHYVSVALSEMGDVEFVNLSGENLKSYLS